MNKKTNKMKRTKKQILIHENLNSKETKNPNKAKNAEKRHETGNNSKISKSCEKKHKNKKN